MAMDTAPIESDVSPLAELISEFWRMGPEIDDVHIKIARPEIDAELLKLIGEPALGLDQDSVQYLSDIYRFISDQAVRTAYGSSAQAHADENHS
jgi:hypothetical protein